MAVEDSVAQDQLRAFIERIERMEEEKAAIAADIKEIYAEAKGNGFDTKILRKIVTIRKQDANERMEQEALLELYMTALDMQTSHEEAMNRTLRRGSAGHSAPLFAGRVEAVSEPITQPQVAPQPAQMRVVTATVTPSPDVVEGIEERQPIQPETANETLSADASEGRGVDNVEPLQDNAGSSNGRTAAFDAVNAGSTPAPASNVLSRAEGVKKLRPLCQSPEACRSSGGKAHCNSCLKMAGDGLVSA